MSAAYLPRILDGMLVERLETAGAVLLEGPKWCGKTSTAAKVSNSHLYMQDPDKAVSYLEAADTKPSLLLKGAVPRLLDEWQTAPVLWDAVRFAVDRRGEAGQFILTSSTALQYQNVRHTGTGRVSRLLMRPMSLFESGESNGTVSLRALFDGQTDVDGVSESDIEDLAFAIVRGGWPASVTGSREAALRHAVDYVEAVIHADISRVDGVEQSPVQMRALLRSLARNISTMATIKTIRDDLEIAEETMSEEAIRQYIDALTRIFVVEDVPAWNPVLRFKTNVCCAARRQFVDPSIAAAVMRLTPERMLDDSNTFGLLFESLCDRDLRVYAEAIDGQVFHYHDRDGLEADAIVYLNDGRWAAIEVKTDSRKTEEAAEHLLALSNKVDVEKMREPSFLMVLTGAGLAYRRPDGVLVVPLGCLKH